jgi:hypothetical protein
MTKAAGSFKMNTDEETAVVAVLEAMESDKRYNTPSRYSSNTVLYPNNTISFAAAHLAYIRKFPDVDPHKYILNLKMSTLIR